MTSPIVRALILALPLLACAPRMSAAQTLDGSVWFGLGRQAAAQDAGGDASHAQLGAGVSFVRQRDRLALGADVRGALRVDGGAASLRAMDQHASFGGGLGLTRRTRVDVSAVVRHVAVNPIVALAGLPADAGMAAGLEMAPIGSAFAANQALTTATETTVTHVLSRRASLVLSHGFTYVDSDGTIRAHTAGVRVERRASRHAQLRLGYRGGISTFGAGEPLRSHDIDAGVNYGRSLPFSRRTTITATTGSSLVEYGPRQELRLLADVSLVHRLGRTWQARLDYGRPVKVVEGLPAPLVSDAVTASVGGGVGRRQALMLSVGSSNGAAGLDTGSNGITSRTASARWQAPVARRAAINAEAIYGRSQFGADAIRPRGVPPRVEHVSVRIFVSYSAPLLR